jgi:hypothetical protein
MIKKASNGGRSGGWRDAIPWGIRDVSLFASRVVFLLPKKCSVVFEPGLLPNRKTFSKTLLSLSLAALDRLVPPPLPGLLGIGRGGNPIYVWSF